MSLMDKYREDDTTDEDIEIHEECADALLSLDFYDYRFLATWNKAFIVIHCYREDISDAREIFCQGEENAPDIKNIHYIKAYSLQPLPENERWGIL